MMKKATHFKIGTVVGGASLRSSELMQAQLFLHSILASRARVEDTWGGRNSL
jgi:hypothetical protein